MNHSAMKILNQIYTKLTGDVDDEQSVINYFLQANELMLVEIGTTTSEVYVLMDCPKSTTSREYSQLIKNINTNSQQVYKSLDSFVETHSVSLQTYAQNLLFEHVCGNPHYSNRSNNRF
ncbi:MULTISPECIES: hypothetical protein [Burkholderia]|uniref:hypothetical protein n=1 Tax=Burkholderia TaxID=32008 RepID=UPI00117F6E48|nr:MULTISPECIES: hypothetical protein [Burkholderia]